MSPFAQQANFGIRGTRVQLIRRVPEGRLMLRWGGGPYHTKALKHADWERGCREADRFAKLLYAGLTKPEDGRVTVGALLLAYSIQESPHKKGQQPKEDDRRVALWLAYLGSDQLVGDLKPSHFDRFVRDRRAGRVTVPGLKRGLRQRPSDTTVGADIIFLQAVLNWAVREGYLDRNPIHGYQRPKTARPKRPVASEARYRAIRAKADQVDPQKRFRSFLDLVYALGWRRSAICQLAGTDLDYRKTKSAPYGRIRKRGEVDKQRVDMWLPMPKAVRQAVDRLKVIGDAWLFPSPKDSAKPWRGERARDLLEAAEQAAGLEPIEGGDFHPYRRLWATKRKHLPLPDVMAAGAWLDERSLVRSYQQVDDDTLLAVLEEPTKRRAAR